MNIECSKEYDGFKRAKPNRPINPDHVERIKKSMAKRGFIKSCHIIVNGSLEILDGQHRFEAARSLGLPIYFVVDEGLHLEDVPELATTARQWSTDQYVAAHADYGKEAYIALQRFAARHGVSITSAIKVSCEWGGHIHDDIKKGAFVFTPLQEAFGSLVLSWANDFAPHYSKAKVDTPFLGALRILAFFEPYNHRRMLEKLSYQGGILLRCRDVKSYLALMENIYNFKSQEHNRVEFPRHAHIGRTHLSLDDRIREIARARNLRPEKGGEA